MTFTASMAAIICNRCTINLCVMMVLMMCVMRDAKSGDGHLKLAGIEWAINVAVRHCVW